jgi:hypothetical protein
MKSAHLKRQHVVIIPSGLFAFGVALRAQHPPADRFVEHFDTALDQQPLDLPGAQLRIIRIHAMGRTEQP